MDATFATLYFSIMRVDRTSAVRSSGPESIPAFFLYGEPLRPPDAQTIHVETIAARSAVHAWQIRPHRHRDLQQLLLLQRGRISASLDGRAAAATAPCLVIVPPGCVHSFTLQEHTVGLVISFSGELAEDYASEDSDQVLQRPGLYPLERSSLKATETSRISGLLLEEFGRAAIGRNLALQGLLSALLANLLRLLATRPSEPPNAASRDRDTVARFRQLLEQRYRDHLGVCEYAQALRMSEIALRRACLAAAGQSPMQLLHHRLAIEAARQLRYTSMTVTQIADFLGFKDPAYFTRFFKREMRAAPTTFRWQTSTAAAVNRSWRRPPAV